MTLPKLEMGEQYIGCKPGGILVLFCCQPFVMVREGQDPPLQLHPLTVQQTTILQTVLTGCSKDKKEMTLDDFGFRFFSSRVISVLSYYLTSLVTSVSTG